MLLSCSKEDDSPTTVPSTQNTQTTSSGNESDEPSEQTTAIVFTADGVTYNANDISITSAAGVNSYLITGSLDGDNMIQLYIPTTEEGSFNQDDSLYNMVYFDYIDLYDYHSTDEQYLNITSMEYENYPVLGYNITVESFKNESDGIVSGSFNGSLFDATSATTISITNGTFNIVLDSAVEL